MFMSMYTFCGHVCLDMSVLSFKFLTWLNSNNHFDCILFECVAVKRFGQKVHFHSAAKCSNLLISSHPDLGFPLSTAQMKRHKNETNGCKSIIETYLWSYKCKSEQYWLGYSQLTAVINLIFSIKWFRTSGIISGTMILWVVLLRWPWEIYEHCHSIVGRSKNESTWHRLSVLRTMRFIAGVISALTTMQAQDFQNNQRLYFQKCSNRTLILIMHCYVYTS